MKTIDKLNNQFESVTLQLENTEIKRDKLIDEDKDTFFLDEKIYKLEDKQYQIQLKIEKLESCS
jgi:hypothetical protein